MPDKLLNEQGVTGLRVSVNKVNEEFLPQLKWPKAIQVYKEMANNDATVGAVLFAIEMLIRGVSWSVAPFSDKSKHRKQADFLTTCLHDMEKSWSDVINDILSFIPYGFSLHEMIFKFRRGAQSNPQYKSKYNDGLIGFRKFPIRSQDTIYEWQFNQSGEPTGFVQRDPNTFKLIPIQLSKVLHFRTSSFKDNPEGKSILRNAYRPWFFKKHIEEDEAVGIARDLVGLPVIYVPQKYLDVNADANSRATRAMFEELLTSVHRNEQEGLLLPALFDEKGNRLCEFKLTNTGGTRTFDTNKIIQRYSSQIAQTALADFILLGQQSTGSFALSSNKTKLFSVAIGAWLKSVVDTLNSKAVYKLGELNGWDMEELPSIQSGDLEERDLTQLGDYFNKLLKVGGITYDEELEAFLRNVALAPNKGKSAGINATMVTTSDTTSTGKPVGDARSS